MDYILNDILILNYNEKSNKFDENDCDQIISHIIDKNPLFICVGTQQSRSGGRTHYQHVLRNRLERINYKLLHKLDASVIGLIGDKNIRTRIYFNTHNVNFATENKKNLYANFPFKNKDIKITNISSIKNNRDLKSIIGSNKYYKGSICTKLEFINYGILNKFIFVNSEFSEYSSAFEFVDLVSKFDLVNKWKNENYNIFFFGDFNFDGRILANFLFGQTDNVYNQTVYLERKYFYQTIKNSNSQVRKNIFDKYISNRKEFYNAFWESFNKQKTEELNDNHIILYATSIKYINLTKKIFDTKYSNKIISLSINLESEVIKEFKICLKQILKAKPKNNKKYTNIEMIKNKIYIVKKEDILLIIYLKEYFNSKILKDIHNNNNQSDSKFQFLNNKIKNIYYLTEECINLKDRNGNTPLMHYCINNDIETIKLLLENGAETNIVNNIRQSALFMLSKSYSHDFDNTQISNWTRIYKLLIKKGADINLQDFNGISILMYAVIKRNTILVKLLLNSNEIDITLKDLNGNKALSFLNLPDDYEDFKKIEIINLFETHNLGINNFIKDKILKLKEYINNGYKSNREKIKEYKKKIEEYTRSRLKTELNQIKNELAAIKDNEIKYIDEISKYFYILKNNYNYNRYVFSHKKYTTKRDKELEKLVNNLKDKDKDYLLTNKIRITFNEETGFDVGGLSREFFDNLETQINLKRKSEKELDFTRTLSNTNEERRKEFEDKIVSLEGIIETCKDYDIETTLKILAVSKLNNNPIYLINDLIRKDILNQIKDLFNKTIEKNFIYNILDYISKYNNDNDLITGDRGTFSLFNTNKFRSICGERDIYNDKPLNNLKNYYIKLLYNDNNTTTIDKNKLKYNIICKNNSSTECLTEENIKNLKMNTIIENNNNNNKIIKRIIYSLINLGIYKNIYDFFFSHFILKRINIESFINNLKFNFWPSRIYDFRNAVNTTDLNSEQHRISMSNINRIHYIEEKMKTIFRELDQDELEDFNKAISGSTNKLSNKYFITFFPQESNIPFVFHTCFIRMDIYYNNHYINEIIENKDNFITSVRSSLGIFNIA
jgi:ankyrin repeat protein